jgi:hypothetical protein
MHLQKECVLLMHNGKVVNANGTLIKWEERYFLVFCLSESYSCCVITHNLIPLQERGVITWLSFSKGTAIALILCCSAALFQALFLIFIPYLYSPYIIYTRV